jgi:hypothetical protein
MLPCQHTPDRNIQLGVLTNQAVKDEKEKEEYDGVETLRLDPASRADSGGVAAASAASTLSTYTYDLIGHRTHEH